MGLGDPAYPTKPIPEATDEERAEFWSRVATGDDGACWPMREEFPDSFGYTHFRVGGKTLRSHRVAYFLSTGRDPGPLVVRHLCHNKRCCNPKHLAVGTRRDNGHDNRGRWTKLTPEDVREIRRLAAILPHQVIGKRYGITASYVCNIANRRVLKYID